MILNDFVGHTSFYSSTCAHFLNTTFSSASAGSQQGAGALTSDQVSAEPSATCFCTRANPNLLVCFLYCAFRLGSTVFPPCTDEPLFCTDAAQWGLFGTHPLVLVPRGLLPRRRPLSPCASAHATHGAAGRPTRLFRAMFVPYH